MATETELSKHFAPHGVELQPDVMGELQSILRLHSISPQELFYKWESYSIKMGGEPLNMELKTARDLKRDIQSTLERDTRGNAHARTDKRAIGATPRSNKAGNDMFGMMEGVVQNTPRVPMSGVSGNSIKRKNTFETPGSKTAKAHADSSPGEVKSTTVGKGVQFGATNVAFLDRANAGQVIESLNNHIEIPEASATPCLEPRIALKANTDLKKFAYKTMAMKISETSETLDDRIDEMLALVQAQHGLEDGAFGNAAMQSPNEVVAVGRIASDTSEGKLSAGSMVLETSRRTGAGLRVPLKLEGIASYDVFPGKIVALRGSNVSGENFTVTEMLDIPRLPPAASTMAELDVIRARTSSASEDTDTPRPLNIITSSGPYTSDTNLAFEPLQALCDRATSTRADALILLGPFLDVEHPLIASGDLPDLPPSVGANPDTATLTDVFKGLIALPLQRLCQSIPGVTIIIVPSPRDAISKHASYPQDRLNRKELGLPKQCVMATNPVMLSLNEFVVGISSQDILFELRREECIGGTQPPENKDLLARLSKHLIEQRHFFPLYPPTSRENLPKPSAVESPAQAATDGQSEAKDLPKATGAMLDTSYLGLAEWQKIKPDVLITPSALNPFAKVVESVVVVNPGSLSKKRGPGTFAQMYVGERILSEEERTRGEMVDHRMFERARVDVVRI